MSKDIIDFEKSFDRATRQVMFNAKEVIKESIEDTFTKIVQATPVGDIADGIKYKGENYQPGNLKGNWQISFDSPMMSEIDRKDPGGRAVLSEIKSTMSAFTLNDTVFFSNNTSYGGIIEYEGGSRKAPEGMMRLNVLKFNDILQTNANKRGFK